MTIKRALDAHWSELISTKAQPYFGAFPITLPCETCGGDYIEKVEYGSYSNVRTCPDCIGRCVPIGGE